MPKIRCERARAAEDAPRGPFQLLERRHGLAEILERRAPVLVERHRVRPQYLKRVLVILAESASRHGNRFAHQRLGFKACAADTKGQTCYICTEAVHWKTKEGLVRGCSCRGTAGFAHVSCLATQAKILVAKAEENNLSDKMWNESWARWDACSLCKQDYHSVVSCALGWACWKTYLGRPETDETRNFAMNVLGNGLFAARHHEDALPVREAQLALDRRLGASEHTMLVSQANLANTYRMLGRFKEALLMRQEVRKCLLKLYGEEAEETLREANNYASLLNQLKRFKEAKSLLRKTMPAARRVLGEDHDLTLRMRWTHAEAIYMDADATLDDVREAVTTLDDTVRIARRVLGNDHPTVSTMERDLKEARAILRDREPKA